MGFMFLFFKRGEMMVTVDCELHVQYIEIRLRKGIPLNEGAWHLLCPVARLPQPASGSLIAACVNELNARRLRPVNGPAVRGGL